MTRNTWVQVALLSMLLGHGSLALADAPAQAPAPATQPAFAPPELLGFVAADYPAEAKAQGVEGIVLLEILVSQAGETTEVKVLTPAGHGFDEAAVAAARQFTWKPANARGKAVAVRVTYEYRFTLTEAAPKREESTEPPGTISGVVLERGTRVPLPGTGLAAIREGETAALVETVSDEAGKFVLRGLPPGRYRVITDLPEHQRREFQETLEDKQALKVRYFLERTSYSRYHTVVTAKPLREEVERRIVGVEEAVRIPGTRGDALRAVESLPGVARPPFAAGFLIIRGTNPEDTTAYIGGHWVPLLYHFGGLTSVVNSDLLQRIDYLPGNFSARYGRATGGVVAAEMRTPRRDRTTGYVDLDLIDAGFLLEGPVGKGSFAIAARRSYIDALFAAVTPEGEGLTFTTAPRYYDFQALFHYPVLGGKLELFVFGLDDELSFVFDDPAELDPAFRGTASNKTTAHRLNLSYRRPLGKYTDLDLKLASGFGSFRFGMGKLNLDMGIQFNSYRVEVSHRPFQNVRVVVGTEGQAWPYSIKLNGPRPVQEGEFPGPPSAYESFTLDQEDWEWFHSVFLEAEMKLGRGFSITPGSRVDYYRGANAFSVDPRLALRWSDATSTVRAGIGQYSEQPQAWETDPVLGNKDLSPENSIHLTVGYDRRISGPVRIETTLFYKWLDQQIVRDDTPALHADGSVRSVGYASLGVGRVYGAEVLLRHDLTKRFFGWVSYALSRSERKDGPEKEWRLFSFDQTHVLTLLGSVKLPWNMEAGLRLRYVTGNPQTPVVGSIFDSDADVYLPISGKPNSERMGSYHQLDVRVDKRFVYDTWMLTAYLDVQNAYNRLNPEGYFYSYDYRKRTELTGLPVIPSIGVKGEF
ncbi:MAG: TonB-dependent receptor [Deltaproteobacteria bacterium]|nr:TonB-dependent receptor [Deltaproteobacteria bacterium]